MKTISTALAAHLAGETTTTALLVKVTRADGAVKRFTSFDRDLTVAGELYKADGGFVMEEIEATTSLRGQGTTAKGFLDSAEMSEEELRLGLYDHAEIEVSLCNWADVSQGVMSLRRGWLGEVSFENGAFTASFRGLMDLLQRRVGETYTPECRFSLGDGCCGIDLESRAVMGSVTEPIDAISFYDYDRTEAEGTFAYGKIQWLSGANAGLSMEVKKYEADFVRLTLWLPMPNTIAAGDTFKLYPGCDKRFSTCAARFNNAAAFGGFLHLPGLSKILAYPDSA